MQRLKFLALAAFGFTLLSSFTTSQTAITAVKKLEGTNSQVQFRIQLATYDANAPISEVDRIMSIEGVSFMESKGKTVFVTAPFSSEEEAAKMLPEYRQMGFKRAMKVVIIDDYILTSRVYHLMYDNRKAPASEKYKLFTPEIRVIDVNSDQAGL